MRVVYPSVPAHMSSLDHATLLTEAMWHKHSMQRRVICLIRPLIPTSDPARFLAVPRVGL